MSESAATPDRWATYLAAERTTTARLQPQAEHTDDCDCQLCRRDRSPEPELDETEVGTHPMGAHLWIIVRTAQHCRPGNTRVGATRAMVEALGQAMDMVGAGIAATRPRAASPAKPHFANRDRSSSPVPERALAQPLPMNPVQGHAASGASRPPSGRLDSDFWRNEHDRVDNHWDRCEVVRRAGAHLAALVRRDPRQEAEAEERRKTGKDQTLEDQVLELGKGHDIDQVAQHFRLTTREVAVIRTKAKPARHPLTGKTWTPPEANALAAEEARTMKAAGLASTDIGLALGRSPNTVRAWTTSTRRAA